MVHEADRAAGAGQPEAVPDWLDENFWGRLADGMVSPEERRRLADLLSTNPYVRRRAAEIAKEWPEALSGRDTIGVPRTWTRWRRAGYALAAGLLIATGVVVKLLVLPTPPRGLGVPVDAMAAARQAFEQGEYREARELAQRLLSEPKSTAQVRQQAEQLAAATYFRRSRQLLDQGHYDEAGAEAKAGIDANYDSVGLRHVLICSQLRGPLTLALAETDMVEGGASATRDVTTTAPTVDLRHVTKTCQAALERYPDSAVLWARLGRAHLALQEHGKAVTALEKSLSLNPKDASVHNWLGLGYYAQENYAEAAKSFETALRSGPSTPVLHYNLGQTYENWEDEQGNQKLGLSLAHYERFLKLAPDSPNAPAVRRVVSQMRRGGVKPGKLD